MKITGTLESNNHGAAFIPFTPTQKMRKIELKLFCKHCESWSYETKKEE